MPFLYLSKHLRIKSFSKSSIGTRKMNLVYDKSLLVEECETVCHSYRQII